MKPSGRCHSSSRNKVLLPVLLCQRVDAYSCSRFRAVDEAILSKIDSGVVSSPRCFKNNDIPRSKGGLRNFLSCRGLIFADPGHTDAILGTGPVNEAGTVETGLRRDAAAAIGLAQLTACACRNGRAGRGIGVGIVRAGTALAACRKKNEGCGQRQKGEAATQSCAYSNVHHGGIIHKMPVQA